MKCTRRNNKIINKINVNKTKVPSEKEKEISLLSFSLLLLFPSFFPFSSPLFSPNKQTNPRNRTRPVITFFFPSSLFSGNKYHKNASEGI